MRQYNRFQIKAKVTIHIHSFFFISVNFHGECESVITQEAKADIVHVYRLNHYLKCMIISYWRKLLWRSGRFLRFTRNKISLCNKQVQCLKLFTTLNLSGPNCISLIYQMRFNFLNEKFGKKILLEGNCQESHSLLSQKEKKKSAALLN